MEEITQKEYPNSENGNARKKLKVERCDICRQYIDETLIYNGHPNNSVEEYIALTDERLMLFTGGEESLHEQDKTPLHRITFFSIYDRNGHLCPFDTDLIENNKSLYISGYMKAICDEDTSIENGIPTKDMGPIKAWRLVGFDGGEKILIGFSTDYADYFLLEPSLEYQPFMKSALQKIYLAKLIIEFLLEEAWQDPTYEDLLQRLEVSGDSGFNEEILLEHAQFIYDQVIAFDESAKPDDELLITRSCMRTLKKLTGVTLQKRGKTKRLDMKGLVKNTKEKWSKAATTNLVHEVFENFFIDQIDKKETDDKGPRHKRCGICEPCQTPDCGKCSHCRDMLKFGGAGHSKQACQMRRCLDIAIRDADEELSDNDDDLAGDDNVEENQPLPCPKQVHETEWIGEPALVDGSRTYYDSAKVGQIQIEIGDYVMLNSTTPNKPLLIAQAMYLFEEKVNNEGSMFHAHLFCRGSDTVLGETADPRELFMVNQCKNCPLGSIVCKTEVIQKRLSKDWASNGGLDRLPQQLEDDGQTFFYTKRYDPVCGRFEDVIEEPVTDSATITPCTSCNVKIKNIDLIEPRLENGNIHWQSEVYRIGSAVFVEPDAFATHRPVSLLDEQFFEMEDIDANVQTEYYRKLTNNHKGSNVETSHPFGIGMIEEIKEIKKIGNRSNFKLKVRRFYRPENTRHDAFLSFKEDLNVIYWSEEICTIQFDQVKGKCYVAFGDGLTIPARDWSVQGPYRFYFTKAFSSATTKFTELPAEATMIRLFGKGKGKWKGKGKGKGKSNRSEAPFYETPPEWPKVDNPLKCMDVFAGCGGLSEGLHQSGIAVTKWGIEKEPAAAHAFQLNNPDAIVFTDDCNSLLQAAISGKNKSGKTLPKKGEVEILVGGPPCQGFSGMNRFNASQYSLFKNSLIVSFLSYCDYYRPQYFILENVRNFVSFKRNMVLKLTLRCLLAIGYQVSFGILQAGNYGVPQTRHRLIIMAAAPGYVLPKYPEPQHVFNKKACQLTAGIDNKKYRTGVMWQTSAPYRTITVRDAMSDLPVIKNGRNVEKMPYDDDDEPISHFQRLMRENNTAESLKDHIFKEMAPLLEGRISQIPTAPGSDWRDLPNIVLKLSDGTYTNILRYPYRSKKQNKTDAPRAVCLCATGKRCDKADRQNNTLIPWCLPHTADRYNNWAGLYGRLDWDGFFSTTITNPEPMGKQGQVLHPEQHRVVSVRECARSQGFPDHYHFYGTIKNKYRQVGNAVPPPLGAAIGREIKAALFLTKNNKNV